MGLIQLEMTQTINLIENDYSWMPCFEVIILFKKLNNCLGGTNQIP